MPPDHGEETARRATSSRTQTETAERRRGQWQAIYPINTTKPIPGALPIDWVCYCDPDQKTGAGITLNGARVCPKCGRSPLDYHLQKKLDRQQHIPRTKDDKAWKKAAKGWR